MYSYEICNKMTVKQLKQICRDNKIKGFSKLKKSQLINHILSSELRPHIASNSYKIKQDTITVPEKKCITCNLIIDNSHDFITYNNKYQHLSCFSKLQCQNNQHHIEPKSCSICLEIIDKNDEYETDCNHFFHNDCINHWNSCENSANKCPNCRQDIKKPLAFSELQTEVVRTVNHHFRENTTTEHFTNFTLLNKQVIYSYLIILEEIYPDESLESLIGYLKHSFSDYLNVLQNSEYLRN